MDVNLIAHTQLSEEFYDRHDKPGGISGWDGNYLDDWEVTASQVVALTAIRTCYSPNKPSEIVALEGSKYFGQSATDGEEGTEADRLIRHIFASKHTSTLEHITYTFAIEGVSRSLLAQLTRHRVGFSFSVQSQRYVRFGSGDKSGGFDYVTPNSVDDRPCTSISHGVYNEEEQRIDRVPYTADEIYKQAMDDAQKAYDRLHEAGVPAEDARMVLPNAATCNLVMTVNLRALLDFYAKRKRGNGAQWEIAELAERLREEVVKVDPWTKRFFE